MNDSSESKLQFANRQRSAAVLHDKSWTLNYHFIFRNS